MAPVLNLIGKKFNKLTVLALEKFEKGRSLWRCQCDCGNQSTVIGNNLSKRRTGSCGKCRRFDFAKFIFRRFKEQAKRRNKVFEITIEHIKALMGVCPFCKSFVVVKQRRKKVGYYPNTLISYCLNCKHAVQVYNEQ